VSSELRLVRSGTESGPHPWASLSLSRSDTSSPGPDAAGAGQGDGLVLGRGHELTPRSLRRDGNTGTRWSSASADRSGSPSTWARTATITRVVLNWEAAYGGPSRSRSRATGQLTSSTRRPAGGRRERPHRSQASGRYVRCTAPSAAPVYGYLAVGVPGLRTISKPAPGPPTEERPAPSRGRSRPRNYDTGGEGVALRMTHQRQLRRAVRSDGVERRGHLRHGRRLTTWAGRPRASGSSTRSASATAGSYTPRGPRRPRSRPAGTLQPRAGRGTNAAVRYAALDGRLAELGRRSEGGHPHRRLAHPAPGHRLGRVQPQLDPLQRARSAPAARCRACRRVSPRPARPAAA